LIGNSQVDYEQIYPEDGYMHEMDENARVWRACNDESERIDIELVEAWNGILDTQILFVRSFILERYLFILTPNLLGRSFLSPR
jgi:hypothetical protein